MVNTCGDEAKQLCTKLDYARAYQSLSIAIGFILVALYTCVKVKGKKIGLLFLQCSLAVSSLLYYMAFNQHRKD
jgi:hypothetical protein